jgi:hypothetical protein
VTTVHFVSAEDDLDDSAGQKDEEELAVASKDTPVGYAFAPRVANPGNEVLSQTETNTEANTEAGTKAEAQAEEEEKEKEVLVDAAGNVADMRQDRQQLRDHVLSAIEEDFQRFGVSEEQETQVLQEAPQQFDHGGSSSDEYNVIVEFEVHMSGEYAVRYPGLDVREVVHSLYAIQDEERTLPEYTLYDLQQELELVLPVLFEMNANMVNAGIGWGMRKVLFQLDNVRRVLEMKAREMAATRAGTPGTGSDEEGKQHQQHRHLGHTVEVE